MNKPLHAFTVPCTRPFTNADSQRKTVFQFVLKLINIQHSLYFNVLVMKNYVVSLLVYFASPVDEITKTYVYALIPFIGWNFL